MSKLLRFILCISIFNAGSLLAMDNQSETHYQVLGVEQNANATQIKKAYFKLAKQWHPDKNKSENAKSMFQKIGNAYRVLSDEKKRAKYDRKLESSQFQYNNSYSPFSNSSYYQSQTNSSFNYSSFDPDVFFEEILRRQREELHRQQETSRHQQELHREYEEQERLRKERKRREREARRRQQERERRQQERLRREREQREREQRARTHCICGERNNLFQLPCQHRVCEEHLVNSIHYRFNSFSYNNCPHMHCRAQINDNDRGILRQEVTNRRLARQREIININRCYSRYNCFEQDNLIEIPGGCGHRFCVEHAYGTYVAAHAQRCQGCESNNIFNTIPHGLHDQFVNDVNRRRVAQNFDENVNSVDCSRCYSSSDYVINFPVCGHRMCLDCTHNYLIGTNLENCPSCYSNYNYSNDELVEILHNVDEVEERRFQDIRTTRRFTIGAVATATVGALGWYLYKKWKKKKAEKDEEQKKKEQKIKGV